MSAEEVPLIHALPRYEAGPLPVETTPDRPSFSAVCTEENVLAAKLLHTKIYLDKDYISPNQLDNEGVFHDEYMDRSTYLFVEGPKRLSSCRYIETDPRKGLLSLPTAQHFALNTTQLKETAHVGRLTDLRPRDVIEISGLVSERHDHPGPGSELNSTRLLYASLLRESLDKGHKAWIFNSDEPLIRSLAILLGKDQVFRMGESQSYMGPATTPAVVNPQDVVEATLAGDDESKKEYLVEALSGVSTKHLSKKLVKLLDDVGIPYQKESQVKRFLHDPKLLAYAGIIGYSSLRVLPAQSVEQFHGSVPLLLGIDVGTAVPYTWGILETLTGKRPVRRALGAVAAAACFAAPYVYFWQEGQGYPGYVDGVAAGLIGAGALLETSRIRKEARLKKQLETSDLI